MRKIRQRYRRGGSAPNGLRHEWTEWQVVDGRKVVARLGTKNEAERWCQNQLRYEEAVARAIVLNEAD